MFRCFKNIVYSVAPISRYSRSILIEKVTFYIRTCYTCFCSDNNTKIGVAVAKKFEVLFHFLSKPCIYVCAIFRQAMAVIPVS